MAPICTDASFCRVHDTARWLRYIEIDLVEVKVPIETIVGAPLIDMLLIAVTPGVLLAKDEEFALFLSHRFSTFRRAAETVAEMLIVDMALMIWLCHFGSDGSAGNWLLGRAKGIIPSHKLVPELQILDGTLHG